jgi:hypothetical protein
MMAVQKIVEMLKRYTAPFNAQRIKASEAYLFSSYSNGIATGQSDKKVNRTFWTAKLKMTDTLFTY